jgi:hypothetical protein
MEQLRNSLDAALYCTARAEGKAGYACRSDDFGGRNRLIFEAGYQDGKAAALLETRPAVNVR